MTVTRKYWTDGPDARYGVVERVYVNNVVHADRIITKSMLYLWHTNCHPDSNPYTEHDIAVLENEENSYFIPTTKCKARKILGLAKWPADTDSANWVEPTNEQAQAS